MSAATIRGFLPRLSRRFASLATVVVFPEPCRPTIITPAGRSPFWASASEVSTGPISASSSSWQILMKWSPGATCSFLPFLSVTLVETTSPSAFSLTRARKRLATLNSTSASSSATRMSRKASSMLASVSSALPVSLCLAALKPLVTASSMRCSSKEGAFYHREEGRGARACRISGQIHLSGHLWGPDRGGPRRAHFRRSDLAPRGRTRGPGRDQVLADHGRRVFRRALRRRAHPPLGRAARSGGVSDQAGAEAALDLAAGQA